MLLESIGNQQLEQRGSEMVVRIQSPDLALDEAIEQCALGRLQHRLRSRAIGEHGELEPALRAGGDLQPMPPFAFVGEKGAGASAVEGEKLRLAGDPSSQLGIELG